MALAANERRGHDYEFAANTDPSLEEGKALRLHNNSEHRWGQPAPMMTPPAPPIDLHYQALNAESTGVSVCCRFTPIL
jgi:hypothetical protein